MVGCEVESIVELIDGDGVEGEGLSRGVEAGRTKGSSFAGYELDSREDFGNLEIAMNWKSSGIAIANGDCDRIRSRLVEGERIVLGSVGVIIGKLDHATDRAEVVCQEYRRLDSPRLSLPRRLALALRPRTILPLFKVKAD